MMRLNRSTKEQFKEKVYKKRYGTISSDLSSMNTLNVVNKAINSFIRQRTWALHTSACSQDVREKKLDFPV